MSSDRTGFDAPTELEDFQAGHATGLERDSGLIRGIQRGDQFAGVVREQQDRSSGPPASFTHGLFPNGVISLLNGNIEQEPAVGVIPVFMSPCYAITQSTFSHDPRSGVFIGYMMGPHFEKVGFFRINTTPAFMRVEGRERPGGRWAGIKIVDPDGFGDFLTIQDALEWATDNPPGEDPDLGPGWQLKHKIFISPSRHNYNLDEVLVVPDWTDLIGLAGFPPVDTTPAGNVNINFTGVPSGKLVSFGKGCSAANLNFNFFGLAPDNVVDGDTSVLNFRTPSGGISYYQLSNVGISLFAGSSAFKLVGVVMDFDSQNNSSLFFHNFRYKFFSQSGPIGSDGIVVEVINGSGSATTVEFKDTVIDVLAGDPQDVVLVNGADVRVDSFEVTGFTGDDFVLSGGATAIGMKRFNTINDQLIVQKTSGEVAYDLSGLIV